MIEYLQEEIRLLKEIHGKSPQFNDHQRKRLAVKAKKLKFNRPKEVANLATPQTLLRWFRTLVAKKYDSSNKRGGGRPTTKKEIAELVVRMAKEDPLRGYTRIRDALDNLGHEVCRGTVANILKDYGIKPAPERGSYTTWADFLRRLWEVIAATDFFTVEIWSLNGIVR